MKNLRFLHIAKLPDLISCRSVLLIILRMLVNGFCAALLAVVASDADVDRVRSDRLFFISTFISLY